MSGPYLFSRLNLLCSGDRVQHVLLRVLLGGQGHAHGGSLRHRGLPGQGHRHQGTVHKYSEKYQVDSIKTVMTI